MNAAMPSPGLWNQASQLPVPLESTRVEVELEDLCSRVLLQQDYRNQESAPIEAVYSFPLPLDAVLLELRITIGNRTLFGHVQPRASAQEDYEEAITDGQRAVLLEQLEPGLYSLSLGNLGPGERAVIRLRYAELHPLTGAQLRWRLPTVLAPRYGTPAHPTHQVPQTDLFAHHTLRFGLRLRGLLHGAEIQCPTHPIDLEQGAHEDQVRLADSAWLDRDLVLLFTLPEQAPRQGARFQSLEDGSSVLLASFCPTFDELDTPLTKEAPETGRLLKLLVDCSGSMAGTAIAQARQALLQILDRLRPSDRVLVVRFGSRIDPLTRLPVAPGTRAMAQLRAKVAGIDADLGGTELFRALRHTLELEADAANADLLLITDGEVWDAIDADAGTRRLIERANQQRQRCFTVGVGSAVSERLVRELAEATGGACVLVSPNEAMAEAIERHVARMTASRASAVQIDWPGQPAWASAPDRLFAGDTVHLFARCDEVPIGTISLQARLEDGRLLTQTIAVPATPTQAAEAPAVSDLARLAASAELATLSDPEARTALAVRYQLLCAETAYLVVDHEGSRQGDGLPALRQVPSMLAAGWGGVGQLEDCLSAPPPAMDKVSMRCMSVDLGAVDVDLDVDETPPAFSRAAWRAPAHLDDAAFCAALNALAAQADPQLHWPTSIAGLERLGGAAGLLEVLNDLVDDDWSEAALVALWLELFATSRASDALDRQAKRLIRLGMKPYRPLPGRMAVEQRLLGCLP